MSRSSHHMQYDILADWNLNTSCNFNCLYCCIDTRQRNIHGSNDIQKIVSSFNSFGKIWLIHMSGGEPFLHPYFINLCKGLTDKNFISINTNLSSNLVYDFCQAIDPARVSFVHCSLHISEREKKGLVDDFIEKVKLLDNSGFKVYVTQVMVPPIIQRFHEIFAFFKRKGILIRPKNLKHRYRFQEYPQSYTKEEKEIILHFIDLIAEEDRHSGISLGHIDPDIDRLWIDGYASFRGLPCAAGKEFVFINVEGNIRRCNSDQKILGNIHLGRMELFEVDMPCRTKICICPYYGFTFSKGQAKTVHLKDRIKYLRRSASFVQRFITGEKYE